MNLPPEIKSVEELATEASDTKESLWINKDQLEQRDLAIWNAAIEKAAAVVSNRNRGDINKQAILNLKRKE